MIALATIVVLQAAVIAGWILQQRRRRRSEAGLRESEARFRHMANDTPVMVWTATPDTLVDYCNPTVLEFTGLSLEQLLGEGWLGQLHPDADHDVLFEMCNLYCPEPCVVSLTST